MPDGLHVQPEITLVLAHQKASSRCHGAKLNAGPEPETFSCRECGEPCERVLGDPQETTHVHGKAAE